MEHKLYGCQTEPLSSYLKALGIFKILSEQKDEEVMCKWENNHLVIKTKCEQDELIRFFSEEYSPSPIMSPWNGGSGFYPNDSEAKENINKILNLGDKRFCDFISTYKLIKETLGKSFPEIFGSPLTLEDLIEKFTEKGKNKEIEKIKKLKGKIITELENSDKIDKESIETLSAVGNSKLKSEIKEIGKLNNDFYQIMRDEYKSKIVTKLRDTINERYLEWIDASILVNAEGKPVFPPLSGSGGNEGRLDYSSLFIASLTKVFVNKTNSSTKLLRNSLFGDLTDKLQESAVGKFDPGKAGGFNQGNEIETKIVKINPWDIILMMEGILIWSNSIGRRNAVRETKIVTPFTVSYSPYGYESSNVSDFKKSLEIWAPIWNNYAYADELKSLFKEGRVALRGKVVKKGLDFFQAINSLGVDRGITGFLRYCFLVRRGQSYIALPSGLHRVKYSKYVNLIEDLDFVYRTFEQNLKVIQGTGKTLPQIYESIKRNMYESTYDLLNNGNPLTAVRLLRAIGRAEMSFSRVRGKYENKGGQKLRPLFGLSTNWINKSDDKSSEFRIALSLSSIGRTEKVGSFRSNIEGTSLQDDRKWDDNIGQFSWTGANLTEKLINTLIKRLTEAQSNKNSTLPFFSRIKLSLNDVMKFINGEIDERCIEELLFAFSLIRWDDNKSSQNIMEMNDYISINSSFDYPIDRLWALVRLYLSPEQFSQNSKVIFNPDRNLINLLLSGKSRETFRLVNIQMLKQNVFPIKIDNDKPMDKRYVASLLFPLREKDFKELKSMVLRKVEVNDK